MAVPGEAICREVQPCGDAPWGEAPDGATTQYVDAMYPGADSDGTAERPWTTIQAAVDAAEAGAAIAVAAGDYLEGVEIEGKPVRLRGRCPEMVELVGTSGALSALRVAGGAGGTEISGLAVRGPGMGVLIAGSEEVLVERVWVTDTGGWGIDVEDGDGPTSATVRGSLVEGLPDAGVIVFGAALSLLDSVVRDIQPVGGLYGRGIDIEPGLGSHARAQVTVGRVVVESTHDAGVFVGGSDATIEASLVRDTEVELAGGVGGYGIWVQQVAAADQPGAATIRQSVVERSAEAGISIAGADVTLESSVVRDTLGSETDPLTGFGVMAIYKSGERSSLTMRTSVVERARAIGVYVLASNGTIESSLVRDILPAGPAEPVGGRGIGVESDPDGERGLLEVRWSVVERAHEMGIGVSAADATIEDTAVRDIEAQVSDGKFGRGINVQIYPEAPELPAEAFVRRCLVERTYEGGVVVLAARATIEETVIRDIRPRPLDLLGGRGVIAQRHPALPVLSEVTLRSSRIEGSFEAGVQALGAHVLVEDCQVSGTLPSQQDGSLGDAVAVQQLGDDSWLVIRRSQLSGSARAGVANFSAQVTLSDTTLDCNPIPLDGEAIAGVPFAFTDEGGNLCSCSGENSACKVQSSQMAPPKAIE